MATLSQVYLEWEQQTKQQAKLEGIEQGLEQGIEQGQRSLILRRLPVA
jgi:flagellar biosynthesis/type III secretory pathway protein FliH